MTVVLDANLLKGMLNVLTKVINVQSSTEFQCKIVLSVTDHQTAVTMTAHDDDAKIRATRRHHAHALG